MRSKWSERHAPKDLDRAIRDWLREPCSPGLCAAINAALIITCCAIVLVLGWMGVVIVAAMCAVLGASGKGV